MVINELFTISIVLLLKFFIGWNGIFKGVILVDFHGLFVSHVVRWLKDLWLLVLVLLLDLLLLLKVKGGWGMPLSHSSLISWSLHLETIRLSHRLQILRLRLRMLLILRVIRLPLLDWWSILLLLDLIILLGIKILWSASILLLWFSLNRPRL